MTDQLAEIKARFDAIIPGPWRWYGNTASDQVMLATMGRGRLYILTPTTASEDYVFDHETMESYTVPEARERVLQWCPVHGDPEFPGDATDRAVHCRCDELREFLAVDHLEPEEGHRTLNRGVFSWLTRSVRVHADLRFPDRSLGERRSEHGGMMQSYRDSARYEVLGYRTKIKWEMDQGGVIPNASRDIREFLYREDFVGLDQPEATFIERAPEDIAWLLARVAELEQALETSERELHAALWERDS